MWADLSSPSLAALKSRMLYIIRAHRTTPNPPPGSHFTNARAAQELKLK